MNLRAPAWWRDLVTITPASFGRRALYAALIATGILMTGMGSIFLQRSGPIPYAFIPIFRIAVLLGSGLMMGLYASGGGATRRGFALSGIVGSIVAFHLEEATIKWIAPLPAGSITGTPVGILGTAGSLLALMGVLLMHVEVESARLVQNIGTRGSSHEEARAMTGPLAAVGARRVLALGLGVAGLAALVLAVTPLFGEGPTGGAYILLAGGIILVGVAIVLARVTRRSTA